MFDGKYFDWNQKRIKGIVDFFGYKFFYTKKVLDLGCGYADMSGVLYRLGAEVTAVDARQEHLKIVSKKFPGIKVTQADLDGQWPFTNQQFDLILDLGLLCHLSSFEKHLKAVCASTSTLVLETAVCDSDNPEKCILVPEGKGAYDLSYSGMGCRPSPGAIEKVLTNCGMSFKRVTSSKYNSGEYTYDWIPQGDSDGAGLEKRALWFVTKDESKKIEPTNTSIIFTHHKNNAEVAVISIPQVTNNSGTVIASTSTPSSTIISAPATHHANANATTYDIQVKKNSKEFALIMPEAYSISPFETCGVILPHSLSSRAWLKKIAPLFPHIQVPQSMLQMFGFSKTTNGINLVMCDVNNLIRCERIWIDEWSGNQLTESHISVLRDCKEIITPSLLNSEEILKALPSANINRFSKGWPLLKTKTESHNHFIYFEKNTAITEILCRAWNLKFGKLLVVGSGMAISHPASYISDCLEYEKVCELIKGSKGIIDISDNNYYKSGILELAKAMGVPIITNNLSDISGATIISQDKTVGLYPTQASINAALNKFEQTPKTQKNIDENHNNSINDSVRKLLGI